LLRDLQSADDGTANSDWILDIDRRPATRSLGFLIQRADKSGLRFRSQFGIVMDTKSAFDINCCASPHGKPGAGRRTCCLFSNDLRSVRRNKKGERLKHFGNPLAAPREGPAVFRKARKVILHNLRPRGGPTLGSRSSRLPMRSSISIATPATACRPP